MILLLAALPTCLVCELILSRAKVGSLGWMVQLCWMMCRSEDSSSSVQPVWNSKQPTDTGTGRKSTQGVWHWDEEFKKLKWQDCLPNSPKEEDLWEPAAHQHLWCGSPCSWCPLGQTLLLRVFKNEHWVYLVENCQLCTKFRQKRDTL